MRQGLYAGLVTVCWMLGGANTALAAKTVQVQAMEFRAPDGFKLDENGDGVTLTSADGNVTVVVAPNGLVDADNVDSMIAAGPIMPFFVPKALAPLEKGARPEQGYRAGTFEMSTLVGPSYTMRLIYILSEAGCFMVVSKATREHAKVGIDAANTILKTFKVSAKGRAAAAKARADQAREQKEAAQEQARAEHAARAEQARREAYVAAFGQRVVGRYTANFGSYDDKTYLTWWLCSDGTYALTRRNMMITGGGVYSTQVGSYGSTTEAGTWSAAQGEEGPVVTFQPNGGQAHAHHVRVAQAEDGTEVIQGLQMSNGFFTREANEGCMRPD